MSMFAERVTLPVAKSRLVPLLHDFTFSHLKVLIVGRLPLPCRAIPNEILCIHSKMHLWGKTSVAREVSLSLIMRHIENILILIIGPFEYRLTEVKYTPRISLHTEER